MPQQLYDPTRSPPTQSSEPGLPLGHTALLDVLEDGIAAYTPEGLCLYLNPAAEALLGLTRARLLGHCLWEVFPEVANAPLGEAFRRVLGGGPPERLEFQEQRPGLWVEILVHRVGETVWIISTDRTRLKKAEARAEALERLTEPLAAARTRAEVANVVLAQGLATLGAYGGLIFLRDESGQYAELLGAQGHAPGQAEEFRRLPLTAPLPACEVIRTGEPLLLGSREALFQRYPALEVYRSRTRLQSLAVLPLAAQGEVLGALALSFAQAQPFPEDERAFMMAVAHQCALALDRARLHDLDRQASARLEAAQARLYSLFMQTPACIALLQGPEHIILLANQPVIRLLGKGDIIGRRYCEVLPEARAQGLVDILDNVYGTGEPFRTAELPVTLREPGGAPRRYFFNTVIQPTRGVAGRIDGVAIFAFDVTELVLARQRVETLAAELHTGQERLRTIIQASASAVWTANASGERMEDSPSWRQFTGQSYEEMRSMGWLRAVHPEDREHQAWRWAQAVAGRTPWESESRLRRADGSWAYVSEHAIPRFHADGSVLEWVGTTTDISGRKAAELALKESESRFRNMADNAPVMLWVGDAAGRCTYASKQWCAFTGLSLEDALGTGWLDVIHPEDARRAEELFLAANARCAPVRLEYRMRRADGEYRWTIDSASPRHGPGGEFLGYIGSVIDITEHKQLEEERARLLRDAEFLAGASATLSASLDYETTLSALARLTVPARADWCLLDLLLEDGRFKRVEVAHAFPEERELALRVKGFSLAPEGNPHHPPTQALLAGRSVLIREFTPELARQSGHTEEHARVMLACQIRSIICVPMVARGRTLGVLTFLTSHSGRRYTPLDLALAEDLARRAALSMENARLYQQAQEAISLRDEFLSVASHELKTPLTPLSLKLQALARETERQADGPYVRRVGEAVAIGRRQVTKLASLIGDLLDVSRIVSGRFTLNWEDVDFAATVRDVAARYEAQAVQAGSPLALELPEVLPGRWDPLRLEQIITNLVENAIKYGAGKPVRVRLWVEAGKAALTVRDQGIGIEPQNLSRIFERFERAVSGRHYGGLGLGLYITRTIVEAMGGTVGVESQLGRGATFTVELPLAPPAQPAA